MVSLHNIVVKRPPGFEPQLWITYFTYYMLNGILALIRYIMYGIIRIKESYTLAAL